MKKEKFSILKGKRYLHFAFFSFALLPPLEKKQRANLFNYFVAL